MPATLTRRALLAGTGSALALAAGGAAAAEGPIELDWSDLVPPREDGTAYEDMRLRLGIVEHGELSTGFTQEVNAAVTHDYDGKRVRIPGFMVPLDYEGMGVTTFLLVPYVGACIHVPPPPPNQIVYVKAAEPYEVTGYFEPIFVTGEMSTMATATELAEIGYLIEGAEVEPYE